MNGIIDEQQENPIEYGYKALHCIAECEGMKLIKQDITSLFIEILALIDFYHEHSTRKQTQSGDKQTISPCLETRLLIFSHQMILILHKMFKNQRKEENSSDTSTHQLGLEHCDIMNAVAFVDDILEKWNIISEIDNKEILLKGITFIKGQTKQGKNILDHLIFHLKKNLLKFWMHLPNSTVEYFQIGNHRMKL
ncbi:MAG: hypothetical protein EZS28_045771, partial [Streblomastix strix]